MSRHFQAAAITAAFYAVCAFPLWGPADMVDGAKTTLLVVLTLLVGGSIYRHMLDKPT